MEGKVADMAMCLQHTGLSVTWYLLYVRQVLCWALPTLCLHSAPRWCPPTHTHRGQWQVRGFPNEVLFITLWHLC